MRSSPPWPDRLRRWSHSGFIALCTKIAPEPLFHADQQAVLGDAHGLNTGRYQPIKLAAMEGLWDTGSGVPATLFAWPNMSAERNDYALEIPRLGSLYLTHSWTGQVTGLKAAAPEDRPNVPIVFFTFRAMVGVGLVLIALALTGAVLRWRERLYASRAFLLACCGATPLGFVAVLAGWTVTEAGRQPFVVYGALRTAQAVASVGAGSVLSSLLLFFGLYNILLIAFLWYGLRIVMRGPADASGEVPRRPGLERAGPVLAGAPTRPLQDIAPVPAE